MRFSAVIAATFAGLVAATPAQKFNDKSIAHIAYTYPNGSYTKPIDVKVDGHVRQLRM